MQSRSALRIALGLVLIAETSAAEAADDRSAIYAGCVEYHAQMYRLCLCQFDSGICSNLFTGILRHRCSRIKGFSEPRAFYGSCLPKLRRTTCATPRRGPLDAPQSCDNQIILYGADMPNPWGEKDKPRQPVLPVEQPKPGPPSEPLPVPPPSPANESEDTDEWPDVPASQMREARITGASPRLPEVIKAQRRGSTVEGSYRICVAASGKVGTAAPVKSIPGADESIIAALLKWTFKPQEKDGCFLQTFEFHVD